MPKSKLPKPWPVKDVRYVEVALAEVTTRHLHIECKRLKIGREVVA